MISPRLGLTFLHSPLLHLTTREQWKSNGTFNDPEVWAAQSHWQQWHHGKQLHQFRKKKGLQRICVGEMMRTGMYAVHIHLSVRKEGAEVSCGWLWGINTAASPSAVLSDWTVADGKATPFCALYLSPITFSYAHMHVHFVFITVHQGWSSLPPQRFPKCFLLSPLSLTLHSKHSQLCL